MTHRSHALMIRLLSGMVQKQTGVVWLWKQKLRYIAPYVCISWATSGDVDGYNSNCQRIASAQSWPEVWLQWYEANPQEFQVWCMWKDNLGSLSVKMKSGTHHPLLWRQEDMDSESLNSVTWPLAQGICIHALDPLLGASKPNRAPWAHMWWLRLVGSLKL